MSRRGTSSPSIIGATVVDVVMNTFNKNSAAATHCQRPIVRCFSSNSRSTARSINIRHSSNSTNQNSREPAPVPPATLISADEDTLVQQFFILAKKNDDSGVEELVESASFELVRDAINNTDQFGNSPLMIAAQRNWGEVIVALQKNEFCDINHQNFFGSSALMCSASHGHLDALRTLCGNQLTQINLLSRFGQTALMKAAQAGKLDSIKILLEYGADAEFINKQGKGAIEIAEEKGHSHVSNFLRQRLTPKSQE